MAEQVRPVEITREMLKDYDFQTYKRTGTALAVQMNQPFQVMTAHGTLAGGEAGDYLLMHHGSSLLAEPMRKEIFEAQYELVEPEQTTKKRSKVS